MLRCRFEPHKPIYVEGWFLAHVRYHDHGECRTGLPSVRVPESPTTALYYWRVGT